METWQKILQYSLTDPAALAARFNIDPAPLHEVAERYPMRINPYYLSLIQQVGDPIWKQAVPDAMELQDQVCHVDPLNEENQSPVPNLVHRYPDRVLFMISSTCAMYCRFCTRKRKVGCAEMAISEESISAGIAYIREHAEIRDVILSGGDPLLLSDEKLDSIISRLRAISHLEIIRIGTRIPVVLPQRITTSLVRILKRYHPLYINTHFNHPAEITEQSAKACARLANAGIPLGNQTVLMRGVNDDPLVMGRLMQRLLAIRVRPYYIYQADQVQGTDHFRTSVEEGLEIIRALRGYTSGMAVPTYVIDAPGGGGKIPLLPDYLQQLGSDVVLKNYLGDTYHYTNAEPAEPADALEWQLDLAG
ncbi:MAG: KamA family radical SAM protein [Deltaproteobacteria bacterium]|nr:KamA family radical SAM protein [Deltaproteobacteria bacterium]